MYMCVGGEGGEGPAWIALPVAAYCYHHDALIPPGCFCVLTRCCCGARRQAKHALRPRAAPANCAATSFATARARVRSPASHPSHGIRVRQRAARPRRPRPPPLHHWAVAQRRQCCQIAVLAEPGSAGAAPLGSGDVAEGRSGCREQRQGSGLAVAFGQGTGCCDGCAWRAQSSSGCRVP